MDRLLIRGVQPWDGDYPFDLDTEPFTYREWGYLKRFSGYLPLTIRDGIVGSDPGLLAALALIVLRRHGRITDSDLTDTHERFLDAPFDLPDGFTVQLEFEQQEDDADSPPTASSNGNSSVSGVRSSVSSGTAGTPGWATSESPRPA